MSRTLLLLLVLAGVVGCDEPPRAYSSRSHDGNVDCWLPTMWGNETWTERGNMCHMNPQERAAPR